MEGFGNTIKRKRKDMGLTLADLAKKIRVSKQVLSQWEREIIKPQNIRAENILNLAKALKMPENLLLHEIGVQHRADKPEPTTLEKLDRALSAAMKNYEYTAESRDLLLRLARELRIKPASKEKEVKK